MNVIAFTCPACENALQASTADAGKQTHCPHCRQVFIVPDQEPEAAVSPRADDAPREQQQPDSFRIESGQSSVGSRLRRRRKSILPYLVTGGIGVSMCAVLYMVASMLSGGTQTLVLEHVSDQIVPPRQELTFRAQVRDAQAWRGKLAYRLAAAPEGAKIDLHSGQFLWQPREEQQPDKYSVTVVVSSTDSRQLSDSQTFDIYVRGTQRRRPDSKTVQQVKAPAKKPTEPVEPRQAPPAVVTKDNPPPSASPAKVTAQPVQSANQNDSRAPKLDPKDQLLDNLYKEKKLLDRKAYPAVRKVFADQFAKRHRDQLMQAYGDAYKELTQWLQAHPVVREELYTAIDPEHDDTAAVLGLFKQLKQKFPGKFPAYANLAIAVAVTWDKPQGAVYEFVRHQKRTKSTMPSGMLGAVENFEYLLTTEQFMQGRAQWLPWEFLIHIINHKTPALERQWAMQQYLSRRVMCGKCYSDVPYDLGMLESGSQMAQLNGKLYNLPNLRQFGGVCAMQADFAARVSKSLGVPAAYVRGPSNSGDYHAWVMWVELLQVTQSDIKFTLQSHGRYRGDQFYVGTLNDPQTGQRITDRDLELRLHTAGMDARANRHAKLLMRAYPLLCQQVPLDIAAWMKYLDRVIKLCPGSEAAWSQLAKMSAEQDVRQKYKKPMLALLDNLFLTFAAFPDFTWKVFGDLAQIEDDSKRRIKLYERLVHIYEKAKRPDLASQALLKLADLLVADKRAEEAIERLAFTMKLFPEEGRYVPRMLDKLEAVCKQVEGADAHLLRFYAEFLPMIPQMRGNAPSKYCMDMFQRGIAHFQKGGQSQAAMLYQAQLAKIKAGQGRRVR